MRTLITMMCARMFGCASANETMHVDGVLVYGQVHTVAISDIHQAIIAFMDSDGGQPAGLEVVNNQLIHGYLKNRDLGWITVHHEVFIEPDGHKHPGWDAYGQDIAFYPQALNCIKTSDEVHVFRVADPLKPHRTNDHLSLLPTKARKELAQLFGYQQDWFLGLDDLMYPDKQPPNVGFTFQCGNNQVVLFLSEGRAQGTFNGEYISGSFDIINYEHSHQIENWKRKYAQFK